MSSFGDVKSRKAPCPTCGRDQRVSTNFEKINCWSDKEVSLSGIEEYYVFQCNGCETVIFCQTYSFSENVDNAHNEHGTLITESPAVKRFWPSIPVNRIEKLTTLELRFNHSELYKILDETYKAVESDLRTLAAMGIRTSFDAASAILKVDEKLTFSEKLEELRKGSFISGQDKGVLEVLVNAGNAAVHRGWTPSNGELCTLVEILNEFVTKHLIRPRHVAFLKKNLPEKSRN